MGFANISDVDSVKFNNKYEAGIDNQYDNPEFDLPKFGK